MKVLVNNGKYATVTKVNSNHFEVKYDNGKTTLVEKHRCEELIPRKKFDEAQKQLNETNEKLLKVAKEIHKLHFELEEQIDMYDRWKELSSAQLADRYRCKSVSVELQKILEL